MSAAVRRNLRLWEKFTFGHLLVLVAYTWWLFALLLVHEARPRRYPRYAGENPTGRACSGR